MTTVKLGFKALIAVFLFSVLIQSCNKMEDNIDESVSLNETIIDPPQIQSTVEEIDKNHPYIINLQNSDQIKGHNEDVSGKILWNEANLINYDNDETFPTLMIPLEKENEEGLLKVLMAIYDVDANLFTIFLNELNFDLTSGEMKDGYTGSLALKTIENQYISKTTFVNSVMLDYKEYDVESITSRGIDMQCFSSCIRPFSFAAGQSGITALCGSMIGPCFSFVSPYNPACVGLAGCLLFYGGYASWCAYNCS